MAEIEKTDLDLKISRYIGLAVGEAEIDLKKRMPTWLRMKKRLPWPKGSTKPAYWNRV